MTLAERPDFSGFVPFPEEALKGSITARFESIAARFAEQIAVSDEHAALTYSAVFAMAQSIANAIGGLPPGQIGILLRNERRYIPAMLGVLAAGRVFVPLNAEHPAERNQQILTFAGAVAVISAGIPSFGQWPVIDLDQPLPPARNFVAVPASPEDLAYIPFTSGSTGQPKGVRRHHQSLLHYALQTTNTMRICPADRLATFNSASVTEGLIITFCAILNGASVHCLPIADRPPAALLATLRKHGVTLLWSVPRLFRHLIDALPPGERFETLRLVALAGDRVDWTDIDTVRRGCPPETQIRVGFGSTEGGVHAQWFVDESLRHSIPRPPVGRTPDGQRLTILADDGSPAPDGEIGEAAVSSPSVALGYWRDDASTARSFSVDPFDPGIRTYRTGDLVMRRPDGLIMYAGRRDQQVKISGLRVETGDVEAALREVAGVHDAAVVVRRNEADVPVSLSAWCQIDGDTTPKAITAALAGKLPRHMVPGSITLIGQLPRLLNFKIDRQEVARLDKAAREERPDAPPRTKTEALLAELWADTFSSPTIGRDDHFFELGGDSLAAVTIGLGVRDKFGGDIDFGVIADNPTLAELAAAIDQLRTENDTEAPIVRISRDTPPPLSHVQETIWKSIETADQTAPYVDTTAWRLKGPLDRMALQAAVDFLVGRHDSLRTTFEAIDGNPVQIVHRAVPVAVPLVDLSGRAEQEAQALVQSERTRFTALNEGPLIRFLLIRLNPDEHWLVLTLNHLVCDAASRVILLRELGQFYNARAHGRPMPLAAEEPLQYGDYATWQRQTLHPLGDAWRREVAWWRQEIASVPPQAGLPFARAARIEDIPPEDGVIRWSMPTRTARETLDLAREVRATPYAVRLAAFAMLLAADLRQSTILVGGHVDKRNRLALRDMIGGFVNIVTLKLDVDPALSFRTWIGQVTEVVTRAVTHSDIPYHTLLGELSTGLNPMPPVPLLVHSFLMPKLEMDGLETGIIDRSYARMPLGFTVAFREHDEDRDCSIAFDANYYDPAKVRDFIDRFIGVWEAAIAAPEASVADLTRRFARPVPAEPQPGSWFSRLAASLIRRD